MERLSPPSKNLEAMTPEMTTLPEIEGEVSEELEMWTVVLACTKYWAHKNTRRRAHQAFSNPAAKGFRQASTELSLRNDLHPSSRRDRSMSKKANIS
eukprot:5590142-Prymnesium_polylepis.1